MADEIILLDTSILIDYFRKKEKSNSFFFVLSKRYSTMAISSITEFEIYTGANENQVEYWNNMISALKIYFFDSSTAQTAAKIDGELRRQRNQIEMADLFIAATAINNHIPLATLNTKHFSRVKNLILFQPQN